MKSSRFQCLLAILFAVLGLACNRRSAIDTALTLKSMRNRINGMERTLSSLDQRRLAAEEAAKAALAAPAKAPGSKLQDCATMPGTTILEISTLALKGDPRVLLLETRVRVHSEVEKEADLIVDYLDAKGALVCQSSGRTWLKVGDQELKGSCGLATLQLAPAVAQTEARLEGR